MPALQVLFVDLVNILVKLVLLTLHVSPVILLKEEILIQLLAIVAV